MKHLKIAAIETHVADARTCCLHPASATHRQMTDEELNHAGVSPDLVRFSCGIEAAEDLGCNRLRVIFRVIMPLSLPGIVSGITMVFVPSVSTFYISQQLGPTDFVLIGDVIETYFKSSAASSYHLGSAISLVLMILIFICMAVMNHFSDDESKGGIIV